VTRRLAYILLVAAAFLGGIATGCCIDDWFDIDTCLDRGGAWDYDRENCRYA
jgi:hypothetical protein